MAAHSDPIARSLVEALRGVLAQVAEPIVVLRTILDQAVVSTAADRGVFVEVDAGGELAFRVLHHFERERLEGESGRFSRGILAGVVATGEGVRLHNALDHPQFMGQRSVQVSRMTSVLCMPIRSGERVAALVHLEHNQPGHFVEEHEALLGGLLGIAGPVLEALQAGRETLRDRDQLRASEARYREEVQESREVLSRDWSFGRFVGRSPSIRELEQSVRKAAAAEFPVLILGETGTGKSILARVLHSLGPRSKQALVTVFCPSLEKGMVEPELFGHRKGAFTGALADRLGKVQAADRGTLFLDEVGELPLEIQPKLLRLLQEKTYERVGDPSERRADVRVISATNRDLEQDVRERRFRRDLYERLNFVPIRVPPLRERPGDIPLLLRHCLDQTEAGRWIEVSDEALAYLGGLDYAWPGNVRQIEQLAARLTLDAPRRPVSRADLERLLERSAGVEGVARSGAGSADPTPGAEARSPDLEEGLSALLERSERSWLGQALRRYPDLTRAELAARLKISESALYKKLRQYGLGG